MKFRTRAAALLLAGILLFGLQTGALAASYKNAASWFQPSLNEMIQLDLIPASFEGYDLSKSITRGEMCELAVYALEKITGFSVEPEQEDYFSDTSLPYILKAYELGIVDGYPDGTFCPDNKLTRQEFFQIVENFCNAAAFLPESDSSVLQPFVDAEKVSAWAQEAAEICVRYGYVNGVLQDDGSVKLDPKGYTSRQEAMTMFLRAYKSLNEYYYYIVNAEVVIDQNTGSGNYETGNDSVVEDVKITGVDMRMMVTTDSLNVRSSWSTNGKVLGEVTYGTELTVTGLCENGWIQILYKGQTAYVSGKYVDEYEEMDDYEASDDVLEIANFAMSFIGYPYVYGAESPSTGFDCSGLMYYVFKEFGYNLHRVADDQMENDGYAVSRRDLQVGDLVFFGSGSYADHVGMYIGNNNFVHAANPSSGVRISSMNETYYAERYLCARRIID